MIDGRGHVQYNAHIIVYDDLQTVHSFNLMCDVRCMVNNNNCIFTLKMRNLFLG